MAKINHGRGGAVALVALLIFSIAPIGAADTPENPNHDIIDGAVRADATSVYFDVSVAGIVEAPVQGVTEFRISFGIRSSEESAADLETSSDYQISYGSSTSTVNYIIYHRAADRGFSGTTLAPQPASGNSSTTFTVSRTVLTTLAQSPAPAGAKLVNITLMYRANATIVDTFALPDFVIPAIGDATLPLHLAGSGNQPFVARSLTEAAPTSDTGRIDVVAANDAASVRFTSRIFENPFEITNGAANLWMSFTTTTPVLAANVIDARVLILKSDGSTTRIGQRSTVASGANANIFTTPGVPQLMKFPLSFTQTTVPVGAKIVLEVIATGILGAGDNGPALLYYGGMNFDSSLDLNGAYGEAPVVPVTDPPLGRLPFSLIGRSGVMSLSAPTGEDAEPVPAMDAATTLAVWQSAPFADPLSIRSATADLLVSSTSTTPVLSLNFLNAKLFAVNATGERLLGQRLEFTTGANPNVFTTPGVPLRYTWKLALASNALAPGDALKLVVTAEAQRNLVPSEATVWTNAVAANSRLIIDAGGLAASVDNDLVTLNEVVTFTGSLDGGIAPYQYRWLFGDGSSTPYMTAPAGEVTATHAYTTAGTYTATLIGIDSTGAAGGAEATLTACNPTDFQELSDVRTDVVRATAGEVLITWTSSCVGDSTVNYGVDENALDASVTIDESVVSHSVLLTGLAAGTTYAFTVNTSGTVSDVYGFTTPGDFSGDAHVVVAYIDTGINPYHEMFRRAERTAHPATYITGYPAATPALKLTLDAPTYAAAVVADAAKWAAFPDRVLHWIPGTNIIGAIDQGLAEFANTGPDTTHLLDDEGHGTWVAGTIIQANPDALLVVIESVQNDALGWAVSQPWIDVISMSYGGAGIPALGYAEAAVRGAAKGKLMIAAAGNDPSPQVTSVPTGNPQMISVGGADPRNHGATAEASKFPDVVSNYTVGGLPSRSSMTATQSVSGTSFATPNVAGTLSNSLLKLRREYGDLVEDTTLGLVKTTAGEPGRLADGRLTNIEMREVLNLTGTWWTTTDWTPTGGSATALPVNPVAPWIEQGWGYIGPTHAEALACRVKQCTPDPERPAEAYAWMRTHHDLREEYYRSITQQNVCTLTNCEGEQDPIVIPGPRFDVRTLASPIETAHPYGNDLHDVYTITIPDASQISVHFEKFAMETGWDFVEIYDGGGTLYATYSAEGGLDFWTPYILGDTVVLHVTSDSNTVSYGFIVNEVDVLTDIGSP